MKSVSKKVISLALSVLMVVSTLVVGSVVSAGATGWTVYDSSSQNTAYFYFDDTNLNVSNGNVYMLLGTSTCVYSSNFGERVSNSKIHYRSANSIKKDLGETFNWSSVTFVSFVLSSSSISNGSHSYGAEGLYDEDKTTLLSAAINITNYTAQYTSSIKANNKDHFVFVPLTSSNGTALRCDEFGSSVPNFTQTIVIDPIGGGTTSANYKSFTGNNSVANKSNITDTSLDVVSQTQLSLTATPDTVNGYEFDGWYEGGSKITSDNPYTYAVTGTRTLTAKFESSGVAMHTMTATAGANGSATVSAASAAEGSTVDFSATADEGYMFGGWYENAGFTGSVVSYDNPYSYTVGTADKTLYAKFGVGLTQTATAGEHGTASVSGGGYSGAGISVVSGTSVSFVAIPDENYRFDGWYSDAGFSEENFVSDEDPYVWTATSGKTLYAKFSAMTPMSEGVDLSGSNKNNGSRASYDDEHNYNTTLSSQAESYYKDVVKEYITSDKVYKTFVALSGAESNDSEDSYTVAQNNSLYTALYNIMSTTHTHGVAYAGYSANSLANYWLYTDTSSVNYGIGDGRDVYTMFYSDVDCFNHEDMQREHIWPKSKASYLMKTGLGGSDLHHLRPAYKTVNNIKSNWGFADIIDENGEVKSGWTNVRKVYWPDNGEGKKVSLWRAEKDGETFCDYNEDVHGDIARILLYIYTRWKQPNLYSDILDEDGNPDTSRLPELDPDDTKDTGERIIYDLPTLLQWMEEDPVSEWEMNRNDLTEDVQGNRNVFIDYPELAWLLFDQEVPDMDTPSGMAHSMAINPTSYENDIAKLTEEPRNYVDPISIDFSKVINNGKATIKAYNNTTHKYVNNGERVDRGDVITYTIIPDQSEIKSIYEYKSLADSGAGMTNEIEAPNVETQFSFSRRAGYFGGVPNTTASGYETSYSKERIGVTLKSKVCELNLKINSKTATTNATTGINNSGGSGTGMITAMRNDTKAVIENGDTVPNGTSVTFIFTPDFGSRFYGITRSSTLIADRDLTEENNYTYGSEETGYIFKKIQGTNSFSYTTTLDCSGGSVRSPKFTVYFAQTFNSNDKDANDVDRHIFNKGMRPAADDEKRDLTDFSTNFEICGVQIKMDDENSENRALRFVSVIDNKILKKAKSYGYVIGYTKHYSLDNKTINKLAYSLVKDDNTVGKTIDCTGTHNGIFGEYGVYNPKKNYTYITASVNNLQAVDGGENAIIIARPYVELKSEYVGEGAPSVIYGQYVDFSSGESYCACSGSYNQVAGLASGS